MSVETSGRPLQALGGSISQPTGRPGYWQLGPFHAPKHVHAPFWYTPPLRHVDLAMPGAAVGAADELHVAVETTIVSCLQHCETGSSV
jgi:hypothetical protein